MVVKKKTKEKSAKKHKEDEDSEDEENISAPSMEENLGEKRNISASKPITKIKKGDKIKIDSEEYEVDAHYVLMDHGTCKEMAIEIFDPKADKDYQLRYFNDQMETTLDFYELDEILYNKKPFKKIEW